MSERDASSPQVGHPGTVCALQYFLGATQRSTSVLHRVGQGVHEAPELVLAGIRTSVSANNRPAVLVYAGDLDPSGEDIDRDFVARTSCWAIPP